MRAKFYPKRGSRLPFQSFWGHLLPTKIFSASYDQIMMIILKESKTNITYIKIFRFLPKLPLAKQANFVLVKDDINSPATYPPAVTPRSGPLKPSRSRPTSTKFRTVSTKAPTTTKAPTEAKELIDSDYDKEFGLNMNGLESCICFSKLL